MSAALMRGSDLLGRPVVAGSTGDDLAEVKDVVFDIAHGTIGGFNLRKRGFLGRKLKNMLPISSVVSVGTDAVMVESIDVLSDPESDDAASEGSVDVLDNRVITESGMVLGTVQDVIIVGGPHPRVVGFQVSGGSVGDGLIPIGAQSAASGSALIVPDSYAERIKSDLTGLASELILIEGER